jgi:pyruvate-formate lyase-activating enzyme
MTRNAYHFYKAGKEVIEFLDLIYKDAKVYLDRKYYRYCRLTSM